MNQRRKEYNDVRMLLLDDLKKDDAFWSYDNGAISIDTISDDNLIAYTLRYLDLPQINKLFEIFSFRRIKDVWHRLLIPEGEYLYTLNRFFAWYLFGIKHPDAYLKSMQTRHLNRTIASL